MLRLVEPGGEERLKTFCRSSALGCRIWSLCRAYGTSREFARFWIQGETEVSAAVALLDSSAVLLTSPGADFSELGPFLTAVGAARLFCAGKDADCLHLSGERGEIFARRVPGARSVPEVLEENPGLREIYSLLRTCDGPGFRLPPFEPFYLDLSHRIRHGAARTAGIRAEGALAACAVTFLTEKETLLSGVAVSPGFRRRGLGRTVSEGLLALCGREEEFLFCRPELSGFYAEMGFSLSGNWAQCPL